MSIIQEFIEHKREISRRKELACREWVCRIDEALRERMSLLSCQQVIISSSDALHLAESHEALCSELNAVPFWKFWGVKGRRLLQTKKKELVSATRNIRKDIDLHNERALKLKVQAAYALIGNVEGRRLDEQQMTAIVKDGHNHLVIAGAGTGKTTTVVGKIKYLLKAGLYMPQDILVLSFTNASASEMHARIEQETGCKIAASTFHKLGLNIITQVEGITPRISQLSLRKFVKELLLQHMQDLVYLRLLYDYLQNNVAHNKTGFEFSTRWEYEDYLKLNPPTTLNNETVKSYGEMQIANFLFENGIQYIYENPYQVDTRTADYAQYQPDFYLPEYGIYIEYFGIDRSGQVPSYFTGSDGKTATELYQESMKWKRQIHKKNKTTLIECFAYEKMEGVLLDNLKSHLAAAGVSFKPLEPEVLWQKVADNNASVLDGIIELFETLINLIKSNNYTVQDVHRLNVNGPGWLIRSNNMALSLVEPIYNAYCQHLRESGEIDFNDMINKATAYVRQGKYISPFRYVIVDEYQDISKARFRLLEALRQTLNYDLFCVGDDWQSIYRFSGSDIGFILNFSKYWGASEISKIETAYRFPEKLIAISSAFVMRNPLQIRKSIKGRADSQGFPLGEIQGYTEAYSIEFTAKKLEDLPKDSTVFLLGRYSFDGKLLEYNRDFSYRYNTETGLVDVCLRSRPDLKIQFLTAHKSKGLQADYVFILNNKSSRMGFPSKIQDAPVLSLLLDNCDQYPFAEERRLFYVAMTRAKKKCFVVTVKDKESEFILELRKHFGNELQQEKYECPVCGGRLVKRSGPYGEFLGCTNYATTGCSYKRKLRQYK